MNTSIRLVLSASLCLVWCATPSASRGAEPQTREPAAPAEADPHEGHAHGAESPRSAALEPLAERLKKTCEHGIPTASCDECRYELGLVKIAPEMLKPADGGQPLVAVETVGLRRMERALDVTGAVAFDDRTTVHITPPIPGVLRAARVDLGQAVRKGDVLLEYGSVELGRAVAAWRKAVALADLARRNAERERALFDRKVSAETEYLEAAARHGEAQAELDAAERTLRILGLTAEDQRALGADENADAGLLRLRAPCDGTIVKRHAAVGEAAEPGDEVLLLADLGTVWAWLDVHEATLAPLLQRVARGPAPVEVRVAAFPDIVFTGTVDHVGATVDETTRTIKVRAVLGNPDGRLRPGMFCRARIPLDGGREAPAVPAGAVLGDGDLRFVFVMADGGLAAQVAVRTGAARDGWVEIADGLKPGDRVVTGGAFLLKSDVLREKMGAGCAD